MTSDTRPPTGDGRLALVATGPTFVRWIVIVLVVMLGAEVAARGIADRTTEEIRWYDAAAQQRIDLLTDRGPSTEVAFAGTSAAWQAFVPAEFNAATGRTAVNVGLAGAVPTVTGPWLAEEVAPRIAPELVVWGLTPLDFAPAYGDLQEDAYASAVETADGWLAELDRSVSSVSTLVASRRLLRSPSELFGSGETQRADELASAAAVTDPDGARIDFDPDSGPEEAAIQRSRLAGYEIDDRDVEAISAAIRSLQSSGTTVVLVEVPLPDRLVDQLPRPTQDFAATRDAIVELGATTGSDVVLMADVFGDTNFVDSIHLDAAAAALTTRWLAEVLNGSAPVVPDGDGTGCDTAEVIDPIGFVVPIGLCRNATSD